MMVFRSIAVPIKAAVGYLLSVGASFGATTLVFNKGWSQVVNLPEKMAIISFFPILTMGILFGLAMDYEVFLVSRMREDTSTAGQRRTGRARRLRPLGKVVVAAAIIMFSRLRVLRPEGRAPSRRSRSGSRSAWRSTPSSCG